MSLIIILFAHTKSEISRVVSRVAARSLVNVISNLIFFGLIQLQEITSSPGPDRDNFSILHTSGFIALLKYSSIVRLFFMPTAVICGIIVSVIDACKQFISPGVAWFILQDAPQFLLSFIPLLTSFFSRLQPPELCNSSSYQSLVYST